MTKDEHALPYRKRRFLDISLRYVAGIPATYLSVKVSAVCGNGTLSQGFTPEAMPLSNLNQQRDASAALLTGRSFGATRREGAARLGACRIGHFAGNDLEPLGTVVASEAGTRREKGLGVRVGRA